VDPSFNTWKFWISSAAIFAGVLASAFLPSCSKAAEPQYDLQAWLEVRTERMERQEDFPSRTVLGRPGSLMSPQSHPRQASDGAN